MDHCPGNNCHRFDNNYYSYSDIEAIGSCIDHRRSNHHCQCLSGAANANGFVVNNYRRRRYLMRMPTHDVALMFLVVNTDALVDCPFAETVDFLSQLRYELALVLVVCQSYRVDSVMLSGSGQGVEEKRVNSGHINTMIKLNSLLSKAIKKIFSPLYHHQHA